MARSERFERNDDLVAQQTVNFKRVVEITTPHMQALQDDIKAVFPDAICGSLTMALCVALNSLLQEFGKFPDKSTKEWAVSEFNIMLETHGLALVPLN